MIFRRVDFNLKFPSGLVFFLLVLTVPLSLYGKESIDEIEKLFEEDSKRQESFKKNGQGFNSKGSKVIKKIKDLKILETFSDIAVIQRRYLPKTKRFEFFLGGVTNLNDSFFVSNGLTGRLGYYFLEQWGVEVQYSHFLNENRTVTDQLLNVGVNTDGLIATNSFYGLDMKWNPVYGKYAYFNKKIIPFDLYFSLGVGISRPVVGNSAAGEKIRIDNAFTYRMATGQIFAMTKWFAFRWELSWHFFSTQSGAETSNGQARPSSASQFYNNFFFNLGVSFFFPEARYR